jgi:hypothetical protein
MRRTKLSRGQRFYFNHWENILSVLVGLAAIIVIVGAVVIGAIIIGYTMVEMFTENFMK